MRALVIGDSGGIGGAVVADLAGRGYAVTGLSRRDGLDLTRPESIGPAVAALSGDFEVIFVATGALGQPEKRLSALEPAALAAQMAVNAAGPVLLLQALTARLPRDRRVVFAVLSARVGSIGDNHLGGWYSYRAAKAALNQLIHTAAIELARSHPQLVLALLHTGTVDTGFSAGYAAHKLSPQEAAARLLTVLEGIPPAETGGFWDYSGARVPW